MDILRFRLKQISDVHWEFQEVKGWKIEKKKKKKQTAYENVSKSCRSFLSADKTELHESQIGWTWCSRTSDPRIRLTNQHLQNTQRLALTSKTKKFSIIFFHFISPFWRLFSSSLSSSSRSLFIEGFIVNLNLSNRLKWSFRLEQIVILGKL